MLETKEFYDLIAIFEKSNKAYARNYNKEDKDWWAKKQVYQDGQVNDLFFSFLNGYQCAKNLAIQGAFE